MKRIKSHKRYSCNNRQTHIVNLMRLSDFEIKTIKESIRSLDREATVYLFGSRTDDNTRGGDIDLLIISSKFTYKESVKLRQDLYRKLDEQKIHIVFAKDISTPFVQVAHEQGVLL